MEQSQIAAAGGPLYDVRVLDLGHVVAGPFAGTLMADFGADVIKIEDPRRGDTIRTLGPRYEGVPIWWKVAGRNKKSLGLDLRVERGREILLELVDRSDVLIENFRPGTLERWELGPDVLLARNPRLIVLRISGFGQGPLGRDRPGYGRVGEAMSGAVHLTGEAGGTPFHVGFSLGDATSGMMAAFGVVSALYARERSGRGQVIDLALFESLFRMIEWQLPIAQKLGQVIGRRGNTFPIGYAVGGSFEAADGQWVTISSATADAISRLLGVVGGPEMQNDPDFADFDARSRPGNMERIDAAMSAWVARYPADEAVAKLKEHDVVAGLVYDAAMMLTDELFAEREDIVEVEDPDIGVLKMPGIVPKLSGTPGRVRWSGARLGEHTEEILCGQLGLSPSELAELDDAGTVRWDGRPS